MNNSTHVRVWDPLVRIFHWSLVVSFTIAYFTSEEDNPWHIYSGYTVLGLIIFRLLWGFIGTKHARFSDFVCSPRTALQYVKGMASGQPQHYAGHNPLGGWMVIALLLALFAVTLSGLKVYAIEEGKGPFSAAQPTTLTPIAAAYAESENDEDDDDDKKGNNEANEAEEEFWEEIHEATTNLMLVLIGLHVFGVLAASRAHKENLIKAMFTGNKQRR